MKDIEFDIKPSKIGFATICTIVLAILKASGVLTCGWWLVFLPVILAFVFYFICIFLVGLFILWYIILNFKDDGESDSDMDETPENS